ncbi:hypothetical protein BBJ28_00019258 [Nothophytophthora sp. Chile5]|nr:hypothetical protein BBJ28_00019258 [Nothophytophthora sp. Chile5]
MKDVTIAVLAALLGKLDASAAFYQAGMKPNSWAVGETVRLNVNQITSTKTLVPHDYYYLPFCQPAALNEQQKNLGETIVDSLYNLQMKKDTRCQVLCKPSMYSSEQSQAFIDVIKDEYYVQWVVDNLLGLYRDPTYSQQAGSLKLGFPVGDVDEAGKYLLYNHVRIVVSVNSDPQAEEGGGVPRWRVVGFEVVPTSIKHRFENEPVAGQELDSDTCGKFVNIEKVSQGNYQYLSPEGNTTVLYTYNVQFVKSDIVWEERWDRINSIKSSTDQTHSFSISNSLTIMLFLAGILVTLMLCTLHRHISRYSEVQPIEEEQEESDWKIVHDDIFRPPPSHEPKLVTDNGLAVV